jgi:hypothetical protein
MATFPTSGTFDVPATPADFDATDGATALESLLAATKQIPGAAARTELTLASGSILPISGAHSVDTEAGAAADNLTNIQYTNLDDGSLLVLWPENTARVVTVKHMAGSVGQISLCASADLALTVPILFQRIGTVWYELFHGVASDGHAAMLTLIRDLGYWVVRAAGGAASDAWTGGYAGGVSGYAAMLVTQTTPASMAVAVAAGLYAIASIPYSMWAAGTSATMVAPVSNPRIDKICLDTAGVIRVTTGAENAAPAAPATPANQFPLATIYHRVGETHIHTTDDATNGYVYTDERHFFN